MEKKNKEQFTLELKKDIRKSFESMLGDMVKGKITIQDFTQKVSQNYIQKRMELSGSIF